MSTDRSPSQVADRRLRGRRANPAAVFTVADAVGQPTPYMQHYVLGRFVLGMDPIAAGINAWQHNGEPLSLHDATYIAEHWND